MTQAVGATEYFDVETRAGQIILTPVRIQRGVAVQAKLAELNLGLADIADAVSWARATAMPPAMAAEPAAGYGRVKAEANLPEKALGNKAIRRKPAFKA